MKSIRQSRILEIIAEKDVETQDELLAELQKRGFTVTQATVSRDIKQLGLIKTATAKGKYKYAASKKEPNGTESKFRNILRETMISAINAENIVVVKTYPGMANAAAAAVDSLAGERIVGSLAGDDTIFIVTKTPSSALEFTEILKDVIGVA